MLNGQKINELLENAIWLNNQSIESGDEDDGHLFSYEKVCWQTETNELQEEVNHLKQHLADLKNFKEKFKQRCQERERNRESYIPLSLNPLSPANRLYWEVAHEVFKPLNLQQMLAIILPSITTVYTAELAVSHPKSKQPCVKLVKNTTQLLASETEVTIDTFLQYAVHGNSLFAVASLAQFSLPLHQELYTLLQMQPELSKQLYAHNHALSALEADIQLLLQKGQTPKQALERLKVQLSTAGSAQNKNSDYAAPHAYTVLGEFLAFLENLPQNIQQELSSLQSDGLALAGIIADIPLCVETAADRISRFLQVYASHPLLNTAALLNHEMLAGLSKKYFPSEGLHCQKAIQLYALPVNRVLALIEYQAVAWNLLLPMMPAQTYALFFHDARLLPDLSLIMPLIRNAGFFAPAQRAVLCELYFSKAKIDLLKQQASENFDFYKDEIVNYFSIALGFYTAEPMWMDRLVEALGEAQTSMLLLVERSILFHTIPLPAAFKFLVNLLSVEEKQQLYGLTYPVSEDAKVLLNQIIEKSPGDLFVDFLNFCDSQKQWQIIFDKFEPNHSIFEEVCWRVPANAAKILFEFCKKANQPLQTLFFTPFGQSSNQTLLHWFAMAGSNDVCLVLFELLKAQPIDQEAVLSLKDSCGLTPLHYALHNQDNQVFKLFIDFFSVEQKRNLVINSKQEAGSFLHWAMARVPVASLDCLFDILRLCGDLPAMVTDTKDKDGRTLLHAAAMNTTPKVLCQVLALFKTTETVLNLITQLKDNQGQTLLHVAKGDILKLLLDFLKTQMPSASRFNFILGLQDKQGVTPLLLAAESLSSRLYLPADEPDLKRLLDFAGDKKHQWQLISAPHPTTKMTLLHHACTVIGTYGCCLLLNVLENIDDKYNALVGLKDQLGLAPVDYAALWSPEIFFWIVKTLEDKKNELRAAFSAHSIPELKELEVSLFDTIWSNEVLRKTNISNDIAPYQVSAPSNAILGLTYWSYNEVAPRQLKVRLNIKNHYRQAPSLGKSYLDQALIIMPDSPLMRCLQIPQQSINQPLQQQPLALQDFLVSASEASAEANLGAGKHSIFAPDTDKPTAKKRKLDAAGFDDSEDDSELGPPLKKPRAS